MRATKDGHDEQKYNCRVNAADVKMRDHAISLPSVHNDRLRVAVRIEVDVIVLVG